MITTLLLLWFACVTLLPFLPATAAHASNGHAVHASCCPASSERDGICVDHGCPGCSTGAIAATATIFHPAATPPLLYVAGASVPVSHLPTFDPPPPRMRG